MFRSGLLVMVITMVSRVLGLVRATIIAYYFGASGATDAYFSAFKISNFFRQLLGEGALGSSFIPLYNEKIEIEGRERKRIYIFYIESYLCFQYYCNTFNDNIFSGYNKSYSKWIPSRNKDIGI